MDLLDYAEGGRNQRPEVQKQILNLLASSPLLRGQLAELKVDLYRVSTQIPDYPLEVSTAAEVTKLANLWIQMVYRRKFSLKLFYRSREFSMIFVWLAALFLVVWVALAVWWYLQ
jgi:hypothetical protein